eukprot:13411619-Heterocapsa_arctica.AAC.1
MGASNAVTQQRAPMMNPMGMRMNLVMSQTTNPMDLNVMQNQANMSLRNQTNMNQMQQQMSQMGDGRMLNPMTAQRQLMMQN